MGWSCQDFLRRVCSQDRQQEPAGLPFSRCAPERTQHPDDLSSARVAPTDYPSAVADRVIRSAPVGETASGHRTH